MLMILLRLIHILAGITWVGAVIFTSLFLFPAMQGDPGTAGKVMAGLARRRYMQFMPAVAILTILAGLWMIWITSGGHLDLYMQTASGHTFTMAGGLGIVGFLLGMLFARPRGLKAMALGKQMATVTDAAERATLQGEMERLQKQSGMITMAVTILVLLAAAGMAIARYV